MDRLVFARRVVWLTCPAGTFLSFSDLLDLDGQQVPVNGITVILLQPHESTMAYPFRVNVDDFCRHGYGGILSWQIKDDPLGVPRTEALVLKCNACSPDILKDNGLTLKLDPDGFRQWRTHPDGISRFI